MSRKVGGEPSESCGIYIPLDKLRVADSRFVTHLKNGLAEVVPINP